MRPENEIRDRLPKHLRLEVHARYLELWCERCKELVSVFRRDRATPEQVLDAALQHRCPQPVYFKYCVRCGREIDAVQITCPFCGADNPPPTSEGGKDT